jgi:hypothetical protein
MPPPGDGVRAIPRPASSGVGSVDDEPAPHRVGKNGDQMTGPAAETMAAAERHLPTGRVSAGAAAVRWCGIGALTAVAGTVVTFAALHLLPPTRAISPVTRTISEYALTSSAWAFDLGVLLLVAASAAVYAGLTMLGRIHVLSVSTLFGALWVAGLLTLVTFPKHNWALGAISSTGQVHRLASLVAFLALPVAVISTARRRGRAADHTAARFAFWMGVVALVWFSPLVYAVVAGSLSGTPWWKVIPLGLVERGLALTEVSCIAALSVLLISAARARRVRTAAPTPVR